MDLEEALWLGYESNTRLFPNGGRSIFFLEVKRDESLKKASFFQGFTSTTLLEQLLHLWTILILEEFTTVPQFCWHFFLIFRLPVCDDEPCGNAEVVAFCAELLGIEPPPIQQFDDIKDSMSPMARSFYEQSRKVLNTRLKEELGYALKYKTYREGMKAQFDEEQASGKY